MSTAKYKNLLLTGAAGGLGKVLRQRVRPFTECLRVSDIVPLAAENAQENAVTCDR